MKKISMILPLARIFFTILLLSMARSFPVFLGFYIVIGCIHVTDRFLTYKLYIQSENHSKLEALGNVVFYSVCVYKIFFQFSIKTMNIMYMLLIIVIFLKILALLTTKWKFNIWCSMHTIANTITGVLLYVTIPICVYFHRIPIIIGTLFVFICFLATFEEITLIFSQSTYDINCKSIFQSHNH